RPLERTCASSLDAGLVTWGRVIPRRKKSCRTSRGSPRNPVARTGCSRTFRARDAEYIDCPRASAFGLEWNRITSGLLGQRLVTKSTGIALVEHARSKCAGGLYQITESMND